MLPTNLISNVQVSAGLVNAATKAAYSVAAPALLRSSQNLDGEANWLRTGILPAFATVNTEDGYEVDPQVVIAAWSGFTAALDELDTKGRVLVSTARTLRTAVVAMAEATGEPEAFTALAMLRRC